jgi:hypothetical protein
MIEPSIVFQAFVFARQNAFDIELCLRLTNGKPAFAPWIGEGSSRLAECKVFAPLLAATKWNQS